MLLLCMCFAFGLCTWKLKSMSGVKFSPFLFSADCVGLMKVILDGINLWSSR